MDDPFGRVNRRMIEMLKRVGMFPLREGASPEELGKRVPLSLEELAMVCISTEIEFASMPYFPEMGKELPDPIVVLYVQGDFERMGALHCVSEYGQISELTEEIDFGDWVEGKYDDYVALFSENIFYDEEKNTSVQSVECKKIRAFFQEIGNSSPEHYLERTRGLLMGMEVNSPVQ